MIAGRICRLVLEVAVRICWFVLAASGELCGCVAVWWVRVMLILDEVN